MYGRSLHNLFNAWEENGLVCVPNNNTDLAVWLQEFANMGLDYIIGFITANARRVPDSLQVGICLLFLLVLIMFAYVVCCLLLLNVLIMYGLDLTIICYLLYVLMTARNLDEVEELVPFLF